MALNNILKPSNQVQNAAGDPLAGGFVNLYIPGTTTFITAYRESGLVTPYTQPIRLSGSGRAEIWITRDCDMLIEDRNNNPILTQDNANPDALGVDEAGGLVPNGSFEIDTDVDLIPDGWTLDTSETGSTNQIDTTESTDGGQCFAFTSTGNGGGQLITTDFFPVNDVDDLRVNFDLRSTVAAVRNIVRVEWYDSSLVSISNSDVYDSTANPTVFTSQLTIATPPALARFAKLRLIGIDPSIALAGVTRFDRISVFYPAVVAGVFDNITIQNNEIITTNTNGDLNLRPNGTGSVVVDFNGNPVMRFGAEGPRVLTDIVTATPPVAEAVTGSLDIYDQDNTDLLGSMGYGGSNIFRITNRMHGGATLLESENASGALRIGISFDADLDVRLNDPIGNITRFLTGPNGVIAIRSDASTDTENRLLVFEHQDGIDRGLVGYVADDILRVRNLITSAHITLEARNAAVANRVLIMADPDDSVEIRDPVGNVVRVKTAITGAFELRSDGNTDTEGRSLKLLHQDGTERALFGFTTTGDLFVINRVHGASLRMGAENIGGALRDGFTFDADTFAAMRDPINNEVSIQTQERDASDVSSGALVRGPDGTMRGIGFNLWPSVSISGGNHTLAQGDQGKILTYDEGTARSLLLNNDANIPVDAAFAYDVGPSAGTLTGDGDTDVQIRYWNGTGWTTTAADGNITIGFGQGTIRKTSDTLYVIVGPNLSP